MEDAPRVEEGTVQGDDQTRPSGKARQRVCYGLEEASCLSDHGSIGLNRVLILSRRASR